VCHSLISSTLSESQGCLLKPLPLLLHLSGIEMFRVPKSQKTIQPLPLLLHLSDIWDLRSRVQGLGFVAFGLGAEQARAKAAFANI
jgi:hypothetical protein